MSYLQVLRLSTISRGEGGGIRRRVIFFSAIEKGRVRKKLARSFYISDTNLKEPGGGSRIIQPFAKGRVIIFLSLHSQFPPPSPLLISDKSPSL